MRSEYSCFAQYYDLLTENVDYKRTADEILQIFRQNQLEKGILLDLACGTGSLSFEFVRAGYDVICADASEQMLSIARQKAGEADIADRILFLCQRMQELDLYGTIDAAVCSLDSINHLTEPEDVRETFRRVSLFMNPSGVFVFDVNTSYKHSQILNDSTFVYDFEELYCVWQNDYDPEEHMVDICLDFFTPAGEYYRRESEFFSERDYSDEELTSWLEEAGFRVQARYGENTWAPPQEDTQRIVYVAKKL